MTPLELALKNTGTVLLAALSFAFLAALIWALSWGFELTWAAWRWLSSRRGKLR